MDSLEITKIVGALLTAGIVASASGFVAEELRPERELEQHAYVVAPDGGEPEAAESSSKPEAAESSSETEATDSSGETAETAETAGLAPLLAAADPAAGQKAVKKCTACHSLDKGAAHKIGPNLWDLVNRPVASAEGFAYSGALQDKSGESWSYDNLDAFLMRPKDWAPGTKMAFAGLKKPGQRAALIAFLRTLSDNPAALPE